MEATTPQTFSRKEKLEEMKFLARAVKDRLATVGKIIYVRDVSGNPFGVIVLGQAEKVGVRSEVVEKETDKMLMGWSFCNPKDKFSKDDGLVRAFQRLVYSPQLLNLRPFLCSKESQSLQVLKCVMQALVGFIPQLKKTSTGEVESEWLDDRTCVLCERDYEPLRAAAKGCRSFARHISNL